MPDPRGYFEEVVGALVAATAWPLAVLTLDSALATWTARDQYRL